ncbi:hypothetical protein OG883_34435 [Streptomyces sp. NBC_01142]|uniref:DUF6907 domain-containing protein n=1 Tax=Streptomyces sp. NBC_01142 TaxID=2975865 RepID=UPI00225974E2|nr:hypothetical protein [Streptomyces sp. NBC_01142]MCX4824865.1 hypothetical protein [Streptomyces sp. NBC_01142]
MSPGRTVTVQTSDHGPVTLPESSWCTGVHPAGGARSDISHNGQPLEVFLEGEVLASGQLCQWPYSILGRVPFVAVEFAGGEHEYDQDDLQQLAARLATFAAVTIPELRARLAAAIEEAGQ